MPTFTIPLPGEHFLRVRTVATRAKLAPSSIYDAIAAGKIATVVIDGTTFIPESEAERYIREWPSKNRGVSNHWAEYREWKRHQREAASAGVAA